MTNGHGHAFSKFKAERIVAVMEKAAIFDDILWSFKGNWSYFSCRDNASLRPTTIASIVSSIHVDGYYFCVVWATRLP